MRLKAIASLTREKSLQRDIDFGLVTQWAKESLICLSSGKCKVMHFGNKNLRSEYSIDNLTTEPNWMYQNVNETWECSYHQILNG